MNGRELSIARAFWLLPVLRVIISDCDALKRPYCHASFIVIYGVIDIITLILFFFADCFQL